jgi:6-pyruvoyltetrahydropterin/6-carboxytetrahydropterin synthase
MYSVTKVLSPDKGYSCCFRQYAAKSHCRFLHGYDLIIEVEFQCNEDALTKPEGWVIDFGGFKQVRDRLDDLFDHKVLVAQDDPELDTIASMAGLGIADVVVLPRVGCEAFAKHIFGIFSEYIEPITSRRKLEVYRVTVKENGSNSATYWGQHEE